MLDIFVDNWLLTAFFKKRIIGVTVDKSGDKVRFLGIK
jgi:hypothetical protein